MSLNANPAHEMMLPGATDDASREAFWGELQTYLEAEVRPGFRAIYEAQIAPELRAGLGRDPDRHEIADAMLELDFNRCWYVARTEAQRQSFDTSRRIVDSQLEELGARALALGNGPGRLDLDDSLPMPEYLRENVHNMSGGYQDTLAEHPLAAGAVFDRALLIHRVNALGPLADDVGQSIAHFLKQRFPDFAPRRILEMGCTVGHTLLPFKQVFPDAEVVGIDVSAPCLRYGFARSAALGLDVHFSQRNAEATGFAEHSFDLVFSRILLHETADGAAERIFRECRRLLRPGGIMFHSDAPQFDQLDSYTASLRDWDIRCNAEPFMDSYYAMPLEQMFADAGFDPELMFRAFAPSLRVATGYDAKETRSGGRYFLAGARVAHEPRSVGT